MVEELKEITNRSKVSLAVEQLFSNFVVSMEEEDEDALVEEEVMSNHVDHKTSQSAEPVTFKQSVNVENEPDLETPVTQRNGEPHFQESPFEALGKPSSQKEKRESEPKALKPEVHTIIPVDDVNMPIETTQKNVPQMESTFPIDVAPEFIIKTEGDMLATQKQQSQFKPTSGSETSSQVPREDSHVPRDVETPRDGAEPTTPTDSSARKTTPTTPSQEIRFNIPFSGVDEPYVILDTQERSPEAIYPQDLQPEVKPTVGTLQDRSPTYVPQGKENLMIGINCQRKSSACNVSAVFTNLV